MKKKIFFLTLLISNAAFAQLSISVSSDQYYVVPDQLLGVNTPLFPDFLTPAPPCTKCEKSNTGNPCIDESTLTCPGGVNCSGTWRTELPDQLEADAEALNYKAMYYPEGTGSRYYHYVPGGKGYCTNLIETEFISQWNLNSGKTNPEPRKRNCNETAYNYANFFEKYIELCRNDSAPSKSMHMVISANVYFGSWPELKYTLEYCAANDVTVDAIVFGTEIEHDQDNFPAMVMNEGDTIPFISGYSYFRRVQKVFIDSIKANPLYTNIPLHFSTGIQYGGQGGCGSREYLCDDTLGKKSLWNRQIHNAIETYNQTHYKPLAFSGAVNWWWFPINNDTLNPSSSLAVSDMNEFFEEGLSANGHPKCYLRPGGEVNGPFSGFNEILVVQWGIKKFLSSCNGNSYENKFIAQLFILKRILNMLENNYNMLYNPAESNGIKYTNAFFQRLGSNNGFNPLDYDPETGTWVTNNISNFAVRQINSVSGNKFRPAEISNGPSKNLEAHYLFNCSEQKLLIINYSDTAFTISNLMVDSIAYADTSLFNYVETSVADTSARGVLAPFNETNQNVLHEQVVLENILIPANGILMIDMPYLQSPASQEICNSIDDDCDGEIDEVQSYYYADADSDYYGNGDSAVLITGCTIPSNYVSDSTDCNDDPLEGKLIYPGANEVCNGLDDNCDGNTDENLLSKYFEDADGDSYGNNLVTALACTAPTGYVSDSTDCNDVSDAIHPAATEICNEVDDNCTTSIDEGVQIVFYADEDGDTYGNENDSVLTCTIPPGYSSNHHDCNDDPVTGALIHPAADELCNELDDNCNTSVDEGVQLVFYADDDGDSYGNALMVLLACSSPPGFVNNEDDCNDSPATGGAIHPQATEICNTIDDNCNSIIDEGLQLTFYEDADGDTYGNALITTLACSTPSGYVSNNGDCNDGIVSGTMIHPGATEVCNAIDDNCNAVVDEDLQLISFYEDADGDGFGNATVTTLACSVPSGFADNDADCDDDLVSGTLIYPGATEVCNGIDDNCDISIDEGVLSQFYEDADGDMYGNAVITALACSVPAGYAGNDADCDDNPVSGTLIHPSALETCNGVDDNCNTDVDEGTQLPFYQDSDGDSYGNSSNNIFACAAPPGYVSDSTDCNDTLANINPGIPELCNGMDENCNGLTDEGVQSAFYVDADADTYGDASSSVLACMQPEGFVANDADCDDNTATGATVYPFATEVCNTIDDDCDNLIDENVNTLYYADADGDGYGNYEATIAACTIPAGYVNDNTDCNDNPVTGAMLHPGATEICNTTDDDCDGSIDEDVQSIFYADADGDGYGNDSITILACFPPAGYVADNTDCNDSPASGSPVHPAATEICNTVDDNCDGGIDEGVQSTFYEDTDGDGYGNASITIAACLPPDGYVADNTDCDDNGFSGASINPAGTEVCNGLDDNCNTSIDEGTQSIFYEDADDDSYGNAAIFVLVCSPPAGYVADTTDCNDSPASGGMINPGVAEVCNGIDDNCNTSIDEGVQLSFYADEDGDMYGNPFSEVVACSAPSGYAADNTDCDDNPVTGAMIHPGSTEVCNSIDDDCNNLIDENVQSLFYADADGDSFGDSEVTILACTISAGYVVDNSDCDDNPVTGAMIHPGATEVCNSIDDDCDNMIDENVQSLFYADADGDSFGDSEVTILACTVPAGYIPDNTDCDDNPVTGAMIHPVSTEVCNSIDDDCDNLIDENVQSLFYADADGDSFGDSEVTIQACTVPAGYVTDNTDCDDNPLNGVMIHPGATEVCNSIDDDCDNLIDENVQSLFYADADGDSFGDSEVTIQACTVPAGYVTDNTDCDDNPALGAMIHPDATELCNSIDDDCDNLIDENVQSLFYADVDGDLFGDSEVTILACTVPAGYVTDNTDCDDNPALGAMIHPDATELCNSIDDDCDNLIDENVQSLFYADADGDSFGDSEVTILACTVPAGYVPDNTDCDDNPVTGAMIHPGAFEVCNSIDDDCDNLIDENVQSLFYADADGDLFGDSEEAIMACNIPAGYVANNTDCDDNPVIGAMIHPGATELCNSIDDDCDNMIDENVQSLFYADADGDSFGDSEVTILACTVPAGYVPDNTDCDDNPVTGAMIHPGATELCNSIDDDCNNSIDDNVQVFYADADGDSFGNSQVTIHACSVPAGYVTDHTDCDDNTVIGAMIHPGAIEVCNGIDDNCNTATDEGVQLIFYQDADGDTYGNSGITTLACSAPAGFANNGSDCNDNPASGAMIHPGAIEVCNDIDDNCNLSIDEGVQLTFYQDNDGDTYGNASVTTMACSIPAGFSNNNSDCDDNSSTGATIHPGATEVCNNKDDNCNTQVDEGVLITFYRDADNDSYGSPMVTTASCSVPPGYVSNTLDCNDSPTGGALVHPGVPDICNLIDDNCNSVIDENALLPTISPSGTVGVCSNGSTTLSANSGTGISYQWIKNNKNIAGETNQTYAAKVAATFQVKESNAFACIATSAGVTITVSELPPATITPLGNLNFCSNASVTLQANGGTGLLYQWQKGSTVLAGATNQTHLVKVAATFKVKVTNAFGCTSTSPTVTTTILDLPSATITPLGNLDICATGSVVLQANGGTGFLYQWYKGDNTVAGATNQNYTATKTATYKVAVTGSNGCSKTSSGSKVTKSCKEEWSSDSTGRAYLNFYPNPTDGRFMVVFSKQQPPGENANYPTEPVVIEIRDALGRLIFYQEEAMENNEIKSEITLAGNLQQGVYWIRLILSDSIYNGKIVYQH